MPSVSSAKRLNCRQTSLALRDLTRSPLHSPYCWPPPRLTHLASPAFRFGSSLYLLHSASFAVCLVSLHRAQSPHDLPLASLALSFARLPPRLPQNQPRSPLPHPPTTPALHDPCSQLSRSPSASLALHHSPPHASLVSPVSLTTPALLLI